MENEALDNLEDTLGPNDDGDITPMTDREIFTKIWTSPRMVFKYINAKEYEKFLYPLIILYGINSTLDKAMEKNIGYSESMFYILGVSLVAGAIAGVIICYLYAAVISWTGGWLEGAGNTRSILRTFAYASIPSVTSLVLILPKLILFKGDIFRFSETLSRGSLASAFFYLFAVVEFILGIWTLVLVVVGLSEVQKFTIGKAIANLVVATLAFVVSIFIIVYLLTSIL